MLTERNLRWGGHVARMKPYRMPRLLLTAWVNNKRPIGRPEQTFGHALKRSLVLRAKQIEKSFKPEEIMTPCRQHQGLVLGDHQHLQQAIQQ